MSNYIYLIIHKKNPGGGGGIKKHKKKYKKSKIIQKNTKSKRQKNYKNKNCFVFGKITGPGFFL